MAQYAQKVDRRQISYFSSFVCFLSLLFWLIWLGVFREKASPKPTKQIKYEGVQLPAGRTNHAADSVLLFGSPRNAATHLKAEISAGYWGKRAGKLWVIAHRRGSAAVGFFFFFWAFTTYFFEPLLLIFSSFYFFSVEDCRSWFGVLKGCFCRCFSWVWGGSRSPESGPAQSSTCNIVTLLYYSSISSPQRRSKPCAKWGVASSYHFTVFSKSYLLR